VPAFGVRPGVSPGRAKAWARARLFVRVGTQIEHAGRVAVELITKKIKRDIGLGYDIVYSFGFAQISLLSTLS
jgi:hypothetical protein